MKRASIHGVKGAALGIAATCSLAVPLGLLLLEPASVSPPPPPTSATSTPAPERRPVRVTPPPAARAAGARGRIQELSQLPTERLLAMARSDSGERLIAVNLLWERGRHADVEALAREDRVLAAKVRALQRARPSK